MNSKTTFLKSAAVLFFILTQHILFAQTFQYSTQNFNITLPPVSTTSSLPYYTLFIETGDGKYYKDSNHIISADASTPYQIPYDFFIPSGSNAILNIVGHYDTIKPPRELYAFSPSSSSHRYASPQITLATGKKIGFAYADKNVVLGDTMTYVVTYQPDPLANAIVAFFYNDNNSFGRERVFTEIRDTGKTYPFVVTSGSTTTQDINAIRVKEGARSITLPGAIPPRVADSLVSARGSFNNAIYFKVPPGLNSGERNAFISMIAPLNSNIIGSFANIKAVVIEYSKVAGYIGQDVIIDSLLIGQFASDPNGIRTTPHCLDSSHGGAYNRPIKYDITFHNDGKGKAVSVIATVVVPDGILLPSPDKFNITSTVSRKPIKFEKVLSGLGPNTYEVVTAAGQRKIIFRMTNIDLPGVNTSKAARKDMLLRHGTISFTLNTISKKSTDLTTNDIPSCLYSDISIVFISSVRAGEETPNAPVMGWDLIRKNCSSIYPFPPPCPRKVPIVVRPLPESVKKQLKKAGA